LKKQIEVKNLSFGYDKTKVLEDINLEIDKGDFVAIIGPNGGGKTTFIKLLLGLKDGYEGEIKIFGKSPKEARSKIGYLPQYINFNMDMPISVEEIVLQGRLEKNKLFYTKKDKLIVKEELKKMHISNLANRKINELSGGQRQKVLLARALARKPDIIILDEPTASIDLEGQKEIYKLLNNLPQTKIVVSHDINILFENVNKVAHIQRKLYLHDGLTDSIKKDDGHFCEMELLEIIRDNNNA